VKIKHPPLTKLFLLILYCGITSCSNQYQSPHHNGRPPFNLLEKAPSAHSLSRKLDQPREQLHQLTPLTFHQANSPNFLNSAKQLRAGDLIAFHMSHQDALRHLAHIRIEKVPYELFQFGHLSLVVENPQQTQQLRLLQCSINQAINLDSDLNYLRDKHWIAYRPATSLNLKRLRQFTLLILEKGSNPKTAYHHPSIIGLKPKGLYPDTPQEIASSYTCCTLNVAALHYAGYTLHPKNDQLLRPLDIITPAQVINSYATINKHQTSALK